MLLDHFYPVISYWRVRKESDELLCTVRSLVMVRSQLPAQVVKAKWNIKCSEFIVSMTFVLRCEKYRANYQNKFTRAINFARNSELATIQSRFEKISDRSLKCCHEKHKFSVLRNERATFFLWSRILNIVSHKYTYQSTSKHSEWRLKSTIYLKSSRRHR